MDVDQSPTAETKPRDPPISKAAHGDSHFVEDLPSTPLALNAPVDNLAILEASLSEDENALAFLRSRAVEGHIRRLAYHKTIEEVDIVPREYNRDKALIDSNSPLTALQTRLALH